jgi:S1-C subfamily serine protease
MHDRTIRLVAGAGWFSAFVLALAFACAPALAEGLDAKLLPQIQGATFEVVAAKPEHDPLVYAKPLPLDLLPFQERTDKYYSLGTAFSIGGGRYVTAGHVLLIGLDSLWGPPALRDNAGHVYAIDKVWKFSLEQDFAVFSITGHDDAGPALELQRGAAAGQAVYTVGNAYGTGVVVRDGLYTSDTPEQESGRWKWMRFSAAASPGNSGGPLVDLQGRVIGVVLAKSPNENLNYALPIGMVLDAPDGKAEMDQRNGYQFDVFDTTITGRFKHEFALPLSLGRFFAEYGKRLDAHFDAQLAELLAKEPDRTFPNGEGSQQMLNQIASMADFPYVVGRAANGNWGLGGEAQDDVRLGANGYVTPGGFGKNLLFHIRRPDDVAAAKFYADPAIPMDYLLKTGFVKRQVGSESVLVTSLGQPTFTGTHADAWGRTWRVWRWPLPFANLELLMLALPVPDGYVGVVRSGLAMQSHDIEINQRALTDFIYANYDGTLAQWKEFLADRSLHPRAFDNLRIDFGYGDHFSYASQRASFRYTPELQAIQPDSVLTLGFSFFEDAGKPTWDVSEIWVSAKGTDDNYLMLIRDQAPPPSLGDEFANSWAKVLERRHPFDAQPRDAGDGTKISGVAGPPAAAKPKVLYTATYAAEGRKETDEMAARLALLMKDLRVDEQ